MKNKKQKRAAIAARMVALILAALMVLGVVASLLPARAAIYNKDVLVRVGMFYNSNGVNTLTSHNVHTFEHGFEIGTLNEETGEFTGIVSYPYKSVTVSCTYDNTSINFTSAEGKPLYSHIIAGTPICIRPLSLGDGERLYIGCASGKKFTGILEYKREIGKKMSMVNVLYLEDYIKGVLPNEIYPSWPAESLKAAAVTARSFVLFQIGGKHTGDDFDVCCKTHCQVFSGNGNGYATTDAAVDATRGQILTYDGAVAMTPYHVSSGGATESAAGCWGGSESRYPYLCGVETPREEYESYPNGTWSVSLTPQEITDFINSKADYKGKLSGTVTKIECVKGNTGYVRQISFYDAQGNSITITNSNSVKNFLSKYVKSANFTVSTYCEAIVDGKETYIDTQSISVMTSSGVKTISAFPHELSALSSEGKKLFTESKDIVYTIDGKGYGHGVGLSQYGSMTLAQRGHDYRYILGLYFPGTLLEPVSSIYG